MYVPNAEVNFPSVSTGRMTPPMTGEIEDTL